MRSSATTTAAMAATLAVAGGCGPGKVDRARSAIETGQPDVALTILATVLADDPTNERALVAVGDAHLLLADRAQGAKDAGAWAAARGKAKEAYASAASLPGASCLGRSRGIVARLAYASEPLTDKAAFDDVWTECPSALALYALARSRLPWASEAVVGNYRTRLTVDPGAWEDGPAFGGPLTPGATARLVAAQAVPAPSLTPDVPDGEFQSFDYVMVDLVQTDTVEVIDQAHPVGFPSRAWIKTPEFGRSECHQYTSMGFHDRCHEKKVLYKATIVGENDDGKTLRDPVLAREVMCTGKSRGNHVRGETEWCEVEYQRLVEPRRRLAATMLVVEPADVARRTARLQALATALPATHVDHLARGRLTAGLPLTDVQAVEPRCEPDPLAGITFAGESVGLTCTTDLGVFTFSDGILREVKWAPAKAARDPIADLGDDGE